MEFDDPVVIGIIAIDIAAYAVPAAFSYIHSRIQDGAERRARLERAQELVRHPLYPLDSRHNYNGIIGPREDLERGYLALGRYDSSTLGMASRYAERMRLEKRLGHDVDESLLASVSEFLRSHDAEILLRKPES